MLVFNLRGDILANSGAAMATEKPKQKLHLKLSSDVRIVPPGEDGEHHEAGEVLQDVPAEVAYDLIFSGRADEVDAEDLKDELDARAKFVAQRDKDAKAAAKSQDGK